MNQQLERRIDDWREYLQRHQTIQTADVEELEDHLRSQVSALNAMGLDDDEAFLVAVKRLGSLNSLAQEFAQEYSERLWKQLVLSGGSVSATAERLRDAMVAVVLAFAAGIAIKLPELFGFHFSDIDNCSFFYFRNLSLFVLPFLAGYFAWKHGIDRSKIVWLAVPFIAGVVVINLLPQRGEGHTLILAALHLPIAMWLAVGMAYTSGNWRNHVSRMNFVRFTGEWFIYYVLIALGGGVLIGFIMFVFSSIGLDAESLVQSWALPCGAMGAVLISGWLVEAKKNIIENIAPVLTRVFTPLFAALLLGFLLTMIWTGNGIKVEREVLIGFDLLLILVLALILFSISVRDSQSPVGLFDGLQLLLIVCALVVDVIALFAISTRISDFGFSPNKVMALGVNLILLVNLLWSAVLYAKFLSKRCSFASVEHLQTAYIPVYGIWAWIVIVLFPIIFSFK